MKAIDTVSPEAVALTAACELHGELLADQGFAGYDGTKEQFDNLYQELFVIARDEVSLEVEAVSQVMDTFFEYQMEISEGQRAFDWYL
jgi:hypothetical protein